MVAKKGFAAMSPELQRQISAKGGKAVRPEQRSFSTNRQLARDAGRKGGQTVPPEKRTFSLDRALATKSGQKGGEKSGAKKEKTPLRDSGAAFDLGVLPTEQPEESPSGSLAGKERPFGR